MNGDGYADVIVAAPFHDTSGVDGGKVWVFHGGPGGLPATASWSDERSQPGGEFGFSVSTAGDVNADGFSDVVVGAPKHDSIIVGGGRAWLYVGGSSGLSATSWTPTSVPNHAQLGRSVSTAGDVNGDGYADVIVGLPNYSAFEGGAARVYHGHASGLHNTHAWQDSSLQSGAHYGSSVSTAGDVNGDGYSDVIVGTPDYDNPTFWNGRVWVYQGGPAGLSSSVAWTDGHTVPAHNFGISVSAAGDVTGDGFSDIIVGSTSNSASVFSNSASVFFGNGGAGLSIRPEQRLSDDSAPIAHLGLAHGGSVRVSAIGRAPVGRARVYLESDAQVFGAPHGTFTQTLPVDSGTSGVELAQTFSLFPTTPYRWRGRLRYSIPTSPYQQWSRWFSSFGNGWEEADFRGVLCEADAAQAIPYGSGKAGTHGVPTLTSSSPPVLGQPTDVTLGNGNAGDVPVLFVGLAPSSAAFDGGTLHVSPLFTISLFPFPTSGELSLPATLPADASLCGVSMYMQAMFQDTGGGGTGFLGTAQTAGLHWQLGS